MPHFSDGSRDDLIQRRAIEAFQLHWLDPSNNPASVVYDGRMLPEDGVALWAWDARPFPAFPARGDAWGDADNWRLGHWLNGRVGLALLSDVTAADTKRTAAQDDCAKKQVEAWNKVKDDQKKADEFNKVLSDCASEQIKKAFGQ